MDMGNNYIGLFDELEKIAEERRKDITKEKFMRHLKAVGVAGLGAGIGAGTGRLARKALLKRKSSIASFIARHPTAVKFVPAAMGAALAAAAFPAYMRTKKHLEIVEKEND